jgi:exonuclease V gamma subunit
VNHRLQAFSPEYFREGPLFSFSRSNFYAARQSTETRSIPKPALTGETPEPDADLRHLSLDDLVRFFTNPPRWFAERRLKLHLPGRSDVLADAERFDTGALDEYGAKAALLEVLTDTAAATAPKPQPQRPARESAQLAAKPSASSSLLPIPPGKDEDEENENEVEEEASFETASADIPQPATTERPSPASELPIANSEPPLDPATLAIAHRLLDQWRRAGRLPAGLVGLSESRRLADETVRFWTHASAHLGQGPLRQFEQTLSLDDFTLTGTVVLRGQVFTRIRPAKVKAKDRIRAWLGHLFALCATGEPVRTVLIGLDEVVEFGAVVEPAEVLQGLVQLYWIGQTGALPFMPETAHTYVASLQKYPDDTDKALHAARQRWLGDDTGFGPPGESLDPACQLAFTGRNLTEEPGFLELTAAVIRIMALHGKDSAR